MSGFDPEVFLNTEVTDASEVSFTPVPKGEYPAYIDEIKMREVKETPVLRVIFAINSPELSQQLNMEKVTVNHDIFLDVGDGGVLQFGPNKNVGLGRLREALNQNQPGKPWNFNMLRGAGPVIISVGERYSEKDGRREGPFATVDKIRRA